jgi:hypothetical protein
VKRAGPRWSCAACKDLPVIGLGWHTPRTIAAEPQMTSAGGLQADRAPPEENKAFQVGQAAAPDMIVPSSWLGAGRTCGRKETAEEVIRHKGPAGGSRRPAEAVHKSRPQSPIPSSRLRGRESAQGLRGLRERAPQRQSSRY